MTDPVFRPALPSEATLLATVHGEAFGGDGWSPRQMRGSLDLTTTQGWVADVGDKTAGFVLFQVLEDEAEILTFCVRPSFRRQGVGEKLLRFALTQLHGEEDAGARTFLEVAEDNEAARALYEKVGFYENGLRINYYKRGNKIVNAINYAFDKQSA